MVGPPLSESSDTTMTDRSKESDLAPSRQAILLSSHRERICPVRISRRADYREVRLALSSSSIRISTDAIDILSALNILSTPPSSFTGRVASIEWNPGTAATPCDNCARRYQWRKCQYRQRISHWSFSTRLVRYPRQLVRKGAAC